MIEQYLQAMVDGLEQKKIILDKLILLTQTQQSIVSEEQVDWDAFDANVDEKAELIEKLSKQDEGFNAVFERIKPELENNKEKYASYITSLKKGIADVTEKSTSLMALEQRTKAKVESVFGLEKQKIQRSKVSSKAASNYYANMNKINYIDPQLMDQKK